MPEEFVVGCPVYKRDWIIPRWFSHVEVAAARAGVEPVYAFVMDERDQATIDAISDQHGVGYALNVLEPEEHDDKRVWNMKRFEWMTTLRNELLGVVRIIEPALFLSLDSDILLHPDAIKNMMETIETCDAVGGKAYMTEHGTRCPSWAKIKPNGSLHRENCDGVMDVEVLMAVKMMRPSAYTVDYVAHAQGEDIGWSLACREKGLKFRWDGRVANKHVMSREALHKVDERVGF